MAGNGRRTSPGAGDDDGANGVVGVGDIERGDHLTHHDVGERVHGLGSVERERCDAVVVGTGQVEKDVLEVAHRSVASTTKHAVVAVEPPMLRVATRSAPSTW